MDLLFAPETRVFSVALGLTLFIGLFELVGALLGMAASSVIDSLLPDVDLENPDVTGPGALTKLMSWLQLGQVPALIWLVLLLTGFGSAGLLLQQFSHTVLGFYLPVGWLAVPVALLLSLPLVRITARWLGQRLLGDSTEAITPDDLAGSVAVITLGSAQQGNPAQARTTDRFGTTHYMLVEPVLSDASFEQGDPVVLVQRQHHCWLVMTEADWQNLDSRAWHTLGTLPERR